MKERRVQAQPQSTLPEWLTCSARWHRMCAAAAMPKKAGVVPRTGIERTRKLGTICAQHGHAYDVASLRVPACKPCQHHSIAPIERCH